MDIWLDTTDIKTITLGSRLGILMGVTTNPSLIANSGLSLEENIDAILKCQSGPITVQVTAVDHSGIIEQAETLREFSERIIVKIPVTQEGLKAMESLSHLQFPVMATAIVTPYQALFACHAGAAFIAPYYSRILNPLDALEGIILMLDRYGFETGIVAASLKTEEHIDDCFQLGIDAITLKKDLFETFIADQSGTFEALDRFSNDWKKAKPSNLLQ